MTHVSLTYMKINVVFKYFTVHFDVYSYIYNIRAQMCSRKLGRIFSADYKLIIIQRFSYDINIHFCTLWIRTVESYFSISYVYLVSCLLACTCIRTFCKSHFITFSEIFSKSFNKVDNVKEKFQHCTVNWEWNNLS